MNFIVPDDFEGSCVLNTLQVPLRAGSTISIYGNDLYAPDVKIAIKRGVLVPVGAEYDKEKAKLSNNAMVVNRTDRVLVLGEIILRPWASLLINKNTVMDAVMQSAEENGFIHIISDEKSFESKKFKKETLKKKATKKTAKKKTAKKKVTKKKEEVIPGGEREVKAKVWNFRDQESEEASVVPKTLEPIHVDEPEVEDIDFIDEPLEVQEVASKKKAKKKASSKKKVKKASKKKASKTTIKKGKATKKKKVKALAVELDSKGRPIENAENALDHLIDSLTGPEDVSFVDDEQAKERYDNRSDME